MARGDGGNVIFTDRDDHLMFLHRLGEVCRSHGWRIHAWVLMPNHFHLMAETPEPNLVSGMKLLLGSFSQSWNRRHERRGHVFQGRYKSVPVAAERAGDAAQLKVVADYIHLNPVRAKLPGGQAGRLTEFEWSSLPSYQHGKSPEWLVCSRVLAAHQLADDGRGRQAYVQYLEARAGEGGNLAPAEMTALRRGWFLGDDAFRDQLLALITPGSLASRKTASNSDGPAAAHGLQEAERLIVEGLATLGLTGPDHSLTEMRKGDPRKVALATLVKSRTSAGNQWLADRLHMGHDRSVSRLVRQGREDPEVKKHLAQL
jgi:REP element-mobilizing transposase RayT